MAEDDTIQKLADYLQARGYPENSLLLNYKSDKYRADLVVVDEKTQTPLQFFILKSHFEKSETQAKAYNKYNCKLLKTTK